jgi:hypothetical protein
MKNVTIASIVMNVYSVTEGMKSITNMIVNPIGGMMSM